MNLLSYTSVPLKYDMDITPATLRVTDNPLPKVEVSRQGGEMRIESRPTQLRLDTFERRSSMGLKNMPDFMDDAAQRGKSAAMEATRQYAEFGNQIMHIQKGANIPDALFSKMVQHAQADLVLVPVSPTNISWVPGSISFDYSPVDLNFDWKINSAGMEFVPGSVSMNITQYPDIEFEYLGGWNYVPPSSNPDYVGP